MLLFVNMQLVNIIIRQSIRIGRVMAEGYEAGTIKALQAINGCYPHITLLVLHNTLGIIAGKAIFYGVVRKSI